MPHVQRVYKIYAYNIAFSCITKLFNVFDYEDKCKVIKKCINYQRKMYGECNDKIFKDIIDNIDGYLKQVTRDSYYFVNVLSYFTSPANDWLSIRRTLINQLLNTFTPFDNANFPIVYKIRKTDGETFVDKGVLARFIEKNRSFCSDVKLGQNFYDAVVSCGNKLKVLWAYGVYNAAEIESIIKNCKIISGEAFRGELKTVVLAICRCHFLGLK